MGYFLPSFVQKRLLRYAISRLELVDTDALDLDRLDIAWGQRSTLELRDVGLRLEKIASLLRLPETFQLTKARILLLRLTLPTDFYSSAIIVEVEGVDIHLRLPPENAETQAWVKKGGIAKGTKANRPRRTPSVPQDQSGKGPRPGSSADPGDNHTVLPSTTDLAQSFLQSEPREEREELEAAIASQSQYGQSQYGQHSVASSDDGDEELGAGTQGMLLPSFIAGFLKGVGDRLQVKIKNVILSMEMEVPRDLESSKQPGADSITTRLTIENMAMEGVTSSTDEEVSKAGKRLISLQNVQAMLIADPQLFTKFSSFSAPSSPAAPVAKPVRSQPPSSPSKSSSSMSSGAALAMTHSTIFEPTPSVQDDPYTLESSAYSHDGRFSDAGTDAEHGMDRSIGVRSALEASQYQDSVLDNPSYLDSVLDQVDDENMEDSIISRPAAQRPVARDTGSQIPRQPTDESPPSSRDSSPRNSGLKSSVPSYASIDNRNNAITKTQSNPERTLDTSLLLPKSTGNLSQRSASPPSERSSGSTPNNSSPGEDLAESKIFTHEEAESMYMSAVSHASESRNQTFKIPGAWDDSYSSPGSPLRKPKESISPIPGTIQEGQLRSADEVLDERCSTPKPQAPLAASVVSESPRTPTKSDFKTTRQGKETRQNVDDITSETSSSSDGLSRMAKQIILIDSVSVWLPSTEAVTSSDDGGKESPRQVMAGRKSPPQSSRVLKSSPEWDSEPHDSKNSLEIDVSSVTVQFDISIGWLVTKIVQKLFNLWAINMPEGLVQKEEAPAPPSPPMQLSVQSLTINFLEHLQGQIHSSAALSSLKSMKPIYTESDVLLRTNILGLKVAKSAVKDVTKTQVDISNFSFGFASEHIIGFDAGLKMRESTRDILSPTRGDISILIRTADETSSATITTLPLHLTLNLQRIDEMFGWFGGLSAILEIGGSIASMSTVVGGSPKASRTSPRRSRGVHFEQRPKRGSLSGSDILSPAKANVRIGGLVVDVIGKDCSMLLETTAVKMINRPEVTGIQVDKARLSGPHIGNEDRDPAVMVDVLNTRVEYLFMPQEQDLDKLLSLLTPSKAKYDQDDDIMLDTLFRQRRQGPVLRVNFDGVKCSSYQSDDLDLLPKIAAEMATLSKVAKYLPEDDRPGILTLAKIKNLDAEVYMQGLVGTLRLAAQGVGAAHVSIPSLMAFKTASATFTRNGNEVLLRPCLPAPSGKAEFPMIMARFIADEMDPTIKIKLFNAQVEYTVPAVMALMGFNDNMTAEDIAINMAASVINFAEHYPDVPIRKIPSQSSTTSSDSSAASQTPFKLAVSIHDSVIGLNPRDLPSKGLLVLTDARFSGSLSKNNELEALVEIKKASIMVVDDIKNLSETESASTPPILQREQIEALRQMGYMPIGYMSSAQAIVKMTQLEDDGDKSLDVEIRDDLFVLETCADSTQTLLSVLNGLSPPTPPSTVEKYRTQIMPLQDLLASMTGEAFVTDERADHEEYDMPDAIQEEPEDEESGPSDLGIDSGFFKGEAGGDSTEDLASMAEDELADSSTFSEATARSPKVTKASLGGSFHSQNSDALAMSELDFKEDHFSSKSAVGGTAHRWNSTQNTYGLTNEVKLGGSPLRVRVRDVHFIWNLFDGYDWQRTRDTISKAVKDVEARATERRARTGRRVSRDFEEEEDSVIGDFLFNSIYIGIPANRDPRELSGDINRGLDDLTSEAESYATTVTAGSPSRQGHERRAKSKKLRLQRSKQHKMTFELGGVSADLVVFPPDSGETQSSLDVRIGDLEIFDHVPTSTWKKFATYMYDAGEKETGTSMVHLEILSVKPIPDLAASELIVKVTVLPLRLHVDQDALDFMSRFFEFKDESVPIHTSKADVPFIQRAEVNSVQVRLDFKPKRVDYGALRSGRTTEFMNFLILQEANMILRHVIIYGVSGFDKLGKTLNDIWMPDVKGTQLGGVLAGLAPARSLVNVASGVKDLVVVPMREYKKDGRVVRSVQKGAVAFAKTTTTELAKLGAKLAIGTQTVLQGAEEFLNKQNQLDTRWEDADLDDDDKKQISLYADQPLGVIQGLKGAYASLERDLALARDAIVAVPGEVMESGSASGAARAVLRRAPTVILRPAIGATKAVGQTLMGATNSLDPANRRRVDDKYKKH